MSKYIYFILFIGLFTIQNQGFSQGTSDELIQISHESGHYENPFYLKVRVVEEATLRYARGLGTMASEGARMPDSIRIAATTPMRLFFSNEDTSFTVELFYAINFKTNFPIVSIAIDTIDMWDSIQGIYVPGPDIYYDSVADKWRDNNFEKHWEKPVSIVMFDTANNEMIAQEGGFRIFGGVSKFYKEKSIRLVSRLIYGKNRFKYKFFKDRDRKSYKSLVLRISGQDWTSTRFRDALATQISKGFNIDIQEYQPVILFLNGQN